MSLGESKVKLGYEEYCLFPDDGNRHEIIDGWHYMNPAPTPNHQSVSRWLQHFLFTQIELPGLGKVIDAPIDVQLGDHDIVQPDLVIVLNDTESVTTRTRIKGPPNMVVEILSPSTSKNDLALKRSLYEQRGISEYWIIDPDEHTVLQLVLAEGNYCERTNQGTTISLAILPEVTVPTDQIFNRG